MERLLKPISALAFIEAEAAKETHGATYASHHEAYGVLAEEAQEAFDELNTVKRNMDYLLRYIHADDVEGIRLAVDAIKAKAIFAAAESVQVAAVCQKWLDMMGGAESVSHP